MRLKYYIIIIVSLILTSLIIGFGIINTMVSLKYETDSLNECFSKISGSNLCNFVETSKYVLYTILVLIMILIIFQKKIVKK